MATVTKQTQQRNDIKLRRHRSRVSSTEFDHEAQNLLEQWEVLTCEMDEFEHKHQTYLTKLQELESLKRQHRIELGEIKKKVKCLNHLIDVHQSLIIIPDGVKQTSTAKDKSELLRIRRESEKQEETPEKRELRLKTVSEHLIKQRSDYLRRIKYKISNCNPSN